MCAMYGRIQEYDVNGMRHTMFVSRTTDPAKLPPTHQACQLSGSHLAALLGGTTVSAIPSWHGWNIDGDILVHWTYSPAAPQAVHECVSCKCKKCTGVRCSCKLNRLTCTGACRCDADDCENRLVTPTDMDVDPLLSEDDSDME